MKSLVIALGLVLSSSAFAHSFDAFVGNYKAIGEPKIESENAQYCNRFLFRSFSGVEVKADTLGYKQSHVLYVLNALGGWFAHPVSDYTDKNVFNPEVGVSATSTGTQDFASNKWTSFGLLQNSSLTVTIQKHDNHFVFQMAEEVIEKDVVKSACYYEAEMVQLPQAE